VRGGEINGGEGYGGYGTSMFSVEGEETVGEEGIILILVVGVVRVVAVAISGGGVISTGWTFEMACGTFVAVATYPHLLRL